MLNLFPWRATVSPPHFKDLYALTGEPKREVDFLAKVGRWTTEFNEGTYRLAYPRRFDIGERHSSRLLTVKLSGARHRRRQTKALYPHHRHPCCLTEATGRRPLQRVVRAHPKQRHCARAANPPQPKAQAR
jgi:hypothetical protein